MGAQVRLTKPYPRSKTNDKSNFGWIFSPSDICIVRFHCFCSTCRMDIYRPHTTSLFEGDKSSKEGSPTPRLRLHKEETMDIKLSITVKNNTSATPEQVAKLIQRLIDVGLEDASETAMSGEGDTTAAELATSLHISAPVVQTQPRVLVIVSGGIADPVYDNGIDVEVFDWDNYNDEKDENKQGVPAHFADLAKPCNVPVEQE